MIPNSPINRESGDDIKGKLLMTTNNDQFVRVPMWILSISKVNGVKFSDTSKTLYCYLKGFDKAYPSYSTIGKVFGISARGAEERVKKLLEMGLIRKDNRPGTSSLFEVLDIPGHEAPEQVPEVKEHLSFDDDTDEELPEEEAPAPEKVKPKPTKKAASKTAPAKQQAVSPFDFKKPRDESRDWWYLERYNDADQFTGFNDFDLPYLAMFESQGKLINQHSILHLKTKREAYARQQQT